MPPLSAPRGVNGDNKPPSQTALGGESSRSSQALAMLTTAQRTTLERIIVRIMAISNLKAPELWAGIRHQVGVKNDADLLAQHFPTAESWLLSRLSQEQNNHSTRRLLQQLTELLPQGNNRQAVSTYIRQHFGQTVLSALSQQQLQQVLTMLKQGEMDIPQPLQNRTTDRSLLPAEHQNVNQQVIKLSVASGESPLSLWHTLYGLMGLKQGDPIPSRLYPLLTQYLQMRQTILPHPTLSLQTLLSSLKTPPTTQESEHLASLSQSLYQRGEHEPLTAVQAVDLANHLFRTRMGQQAGAHIHSPESQDSRYVLPTPLVAACEPDNSSFFTPSRLLGFVLLIALIALIIWIF